jgi:hypothetical protein
MYSIWTSAACLEQPKRQAMDDLLKRDYSITQFIAHQSFMAFNPHKTSVV